LFPCVGSGLVLAIGLTLAPFAAGAQPAERVTKIGILSTVNSRTATFFEAMVQRLRELGHVEGQNLVIEFRNAEGDVTRLPALAAELVRLNVNIILASGPEVTLQAARKATATVPIVIAAVDFDPVARGYIVSLAKPGGNITGVSLLQIELTGKRMQFLKEALPKVARVVVFWDTISADQWREAEKMAVGVDLRLQGVELRNPPTTSATRFGRQRAGAQRRSCFSCRQFSSGREHRSSNLDSRVGFPPSPACHSMPMPAPSCPTARISMTCSGMLPCTSTRS
jgi:putative ABC transport system substrate-binding protein